MEFVEDNFGEQPEIDEEPKSPSLSALEQAEELQLPTDNDASKKPRRKPTDLSHMTPEQKAEHKKERALSEPIRAEAKRMAVEAQIKAAEARMIMMKALQSLLNQRMADAGR